MAFLRTHAPLTRKEAVAAPYHECEIAAGINNNSDVAARTLKDTKEATASATKTARTHETLRP